MECADISQIADRYDDPIRNLPIELATDFNANRFLAFDPQAVHRICEVDGIVLGNFLNDFHAAIKVGVEGHYVSAIGNGLNQLGRADLARRQENDCRNARVGCIGRQGGAGITGTRTRHRFDRVVLHRHHLFDNADQHGHAKVFEAAGVAVAAEFDPKVRQVQLLAQPIGPEQVGVSFTHADDIFILQVGNHPFSHGPDSAAVGPVGRADPGIEKLLPLVGDSLAQ